jgi:hypothetical protein
MTAQPHWSPVDDETNDLLTLVADTEHPSVDFEWLVYTRALAEAADPFGVIDPNRLRPLIRDHIAPRRIGAFTNKALAERLVEYTGEWVVSDDHAGRNGGKPCRVMRLIT